MSRTLFGLWAAMILAAAPQVASADFPADLAKWIETDPPKPGSSRWGRANHSRHEWVVTLREGHPQARLRNREDETPASLPFEFEGGKAKDGLYGRRRFHAKVADGWIVAWNAGEFGGGLWWFSPDGKRRDKLAEARVIGLFPTAGGVLAPEGLAHLSSSEGRVLRVIQDPGGRWRAEALVDLKHAPEVATTAADGSMIVATTDRLLRVVPAGKKVEVLLDDAFWGGLYPNSMAIAPDGTFYLGMRHGVAKIEKKGGAYRSGWLLPNKEFAAGGPRNRSK